MRTVVIGAGGIDRALDFVNVDVAASLNGSIGAMQSLTTVRSME